MSHPTNILVVSADSDHAFLAELQSHLFLLERENLIRLWGRWSVIPGQVLEGELDCMLDVAGFVLVLVSADVFQSPSYQHVTSRLSAAVPGHQTPLVPVLIRPCNWATSELAKLAPLPRSGIPVSIWKDRDEAWTEITEGVRQIIGTEGSTDSTRSSSPQPESAALEFEQARSVADGRTGSLWEAFAVAVKQQWTTQPRARLLNAVLRLRDAMVLCQAHYERHRDASSAQELGRERWAWFRALSRANDALADVDGILHIFSPDAKREVDKYLGDEADTVDEVLDVLARDLGVNTAIDFDAVVLRSSFDRALEMLDRFIRSNFQPEEVYDAKRPHPSGMADDKNCPTR